MQHARRHRVGMEVFRQQPPNHELATDRALDGVLGAQDRDVLQGHTHVTYPMFALASGVDDRVCKHLRHICKNKSVFE